MVVLYATLLCMKEFATVKELVALTGEVFEKPIGETAIRKHITKAGVKATRRGVYPVAPILQAIKEGRENHYSPTGDSPTSDMRAKKLALECELLQAKIDEVRRVTMPVEECRDVLVKHMQIVRRSIQNFPKDVSGILNDAAAIKAIEDKCRSILDQLSEECGQYDRTR